MFTRGLTLVCNESKPSKAVKLLGLVGSCRAHTKIAHLPVGILRCPCDFPEWFNSFSAGKATCPHSCPEIISNGTQFASTAPITTVDLTVKLELNF